MFNLPDPEKTIDYAIYSVKIIALLSWSISIYVDQGARCTGPIYPNFQHQAGLMMIARRGKRRT
jgi:hypothetical protein